MIDPPPRPVGENDEQRVLRSRHGLGELKPAIRIDVRHRAFETTQTFRRDPAAFDLHLQRTAGTDQRHPSLIDRHAGLGVDQPGQLERLRRVRRFDVKDQNQES